MISATYFLRYFFLIFFIVPQSSANKNIFCSYLNREKSKELQFPIQNVDPFLCTHIVYSSIDTDRKASIVIFKSGLEGDFTELNKLKSSNTNLKTLIDVGGSEVFYTVIQQESLRKTLIKNIVDFAIKYGFNGVYLNWRLNNMYDVSISIQFLKEIRKATSEKGLLLTSEILPYGSQVLFNHYLKANGLVDFLSIDILNSSTVYEKKTSARLKLSTLQQTIYNIIFRKFPAEKIVFLIKHFRPEEYTLLYPTLNYFGAPTNGFPVLHMYTKVCGKQLDGYIQMWDERQYVQYAYKNNQWISYENKHSLGLRVKFIMSMNFAGIMVDLHEDDFNNVCGEGKYSMIDHIKQSMNETSFFIYTNSKEFNTDTKTKMLKNMTLDAKNICKSTGYVENPNDCDKFYYCMKNEGGILEIREFNCPNGLVFDEELLVCNYLYIIGPEL